jgi:NADPH-dependent ferric siderophore reductase
MSALTKTLGSVLEKTLMAPAQVTAVTALGGFRLIELRGEGLKKSGWTPGDKLRVKTGDLELRTYTPLLWDDKKGLAHRVAWLPGRGPGSAWAAAVKPGESFFFKGPKESLKLSKAGEGPVVFFGDETAVGAAAALRRLRPLDKDLRFVFELDDPDEAHVALIALGLPDAARVAKSEDGSHLKAVRKQIQAWAGESQGNAYVFLVGNQESVKTLKSKLSDKLPDAKIKAKVYWREGKAGLD